ncbi:small integral membrane protein 11A [Rattus rattus]|uniref:small integral membrane protein 11A n=1 Tax=Rattus rattus TaxID=10117 RepID=UPI0013F35259|nr:small integral membrane protein 11A [Rattus rattus]
MRLPRVLSSGSPALTCFSDSLSPDQNLQLLGPGLEAASHADVYWLRQSQVNHSWPAMNWKVLEHVPLLLYILAAKTLILCLAFAGVKMYQRRNLERKLQAEKKRQSERKEN